MNHRRYIGCTVYGVVPFKPTGCICRSNGNVHLYFQNMKNPGPPLLAALGFLVAKPADQVVAQDGLGGDEVGAENHVLDLVVFYEVFKTRYAVFPVVYGVYLVIILGQERGQAVAKGVFDQ